jgi:hypothetical protein
MDKTPKTPTRINAELIYYLLEDLKRENQSFRAEFKQELIDLKLRYVTKEESQALKEQIEGLSDEIKELKGRSTIKNTVLWVGLTASAIINIIALYNVFGGHK